MAELTVPATLENLEIVTGFIHERLNMLQRQALSGLFAVWRRLSHNDTMSAKRHGIIANQKAAVAHTRAVGHDPGIITALRLLYHIREAVWYNRPSGRKRAAPAYRLGHNLGIITALRLLCHIREAAWYNRPSKGDCRVSSEPLGISRYN